MGRTAAGSPGGSTGGRRARENLGVETKWVEKKGAGLHRGPTRWETVGPEEGQSERAVAGGTESWMGTEREGRGGELMGGMGWGQKRAGENS